MLDDVIEAVRAGESRALVVHGEPGIGKSALLRHLVTRAGELRILATTGRPSEAELPFAGLHQLFGTMTERIDRLPVPQRNALQVAFGLREGDPPDRYVVSLGVLGLVAELARECPVLCVVDDEQWMDRATVLTLTFVARRMKSDAAAVVFASREGREEFQGLPTLVLSGLSAHHARELLDSVMTGPLDPSVRHQIVTETHGNPRALLDVARGVGPAELAGGFRFPGAVPLSPPIERDYRRRLDALPPSARQFLLLAAADPVGDPTTLWSAAARLGLELPALTPALASGLISLGARVEFRNPLARSAVYRAAGLVARREVHDALAAVTDPSSDPDRRAWHRAHAADRPDEDAAVELERSAGHARSRGGLAAAAAFLRRAAELTADPSLRTRRLIAAAEASRDAGGHEAALVLLDTASMRPLDDEHAARVMRIRGIIAIEQHRRVDGVELLLGAAARFGPDHAADARATALEALVGTFWDAKPHDPLFAKAAASVADLVRGSRAPSTLTDLLLEGLYVRIVDGFAAAAPLLRRAVDRLVTAAPTDRWQVFGANRLFLMLAEELWDEDAMGVLATRQVVVCRRDGALAALQQALNYSAFHRMHEGDFLAAAALIEESHTVAAVSTGRTNRHVEVVLSAWRGDESRTPKLSAEVRQPVLEGRGTFGFCADYADAVLANALGRFDVALAAAKRAFDYDQRIVASMVVSEIIDAASRTGDVDALRSVRDWLAERVAATPRPWNFGLHERCLALLSDDDRAEAHYQESIAQLSTTRARLEIARSQLLFGEWLRRRGRRGDARRYLREAHQTFHALGSAGFAGRAARELQATGDATIRAAESGHPSLTAQEAQVAALAGAGLTNPEIGARLFISPRTVQYHLRKVFLKLGITSRAQLAQALPPEAAGLGDLGGRRRLEPA
ncbi:LuxR family transcriptional regulator [Cryptosporangium japonicum]|uniref:LuxR family transcriptional regulator n=1 Tax=Cryptosporangium japonicum TaxID=80872 RepID=A0ABN0U8Y4_9ACTN